MVLKKHEPPLTKHEPPYCSIDYNHEKRAYSIFVRAHGKQGIIHLAEENFAHLGSETEELEELRSKLASMQKDMVGQIQKISKAFEEKLQDERRLRAEAEERIEHLQDQVSRQERELQRGYVPNSIPIGGDGYVYISDGVGSGSWGTLPIYEGGTSSAKVPSGWADTGSSGVTTKDDAL